jgi:TP901 family phage tail tape measure protein
VADETRNANVVVSADIAAYNAQMQQGVQSTNKMTGAVDKLSHSLEGITKRAGKKLLIFAAADLAALTGVTVVAAKFEKQLATLHATTAVSGKSMDAYRKGINQLALQIPVSRGEVTALTTAISQMGITSQREVVRMTEVFEKMGSATQESTGALAQSMIELSRTMGTLGNGAVGMQNMSDSVVQLSADMGVSATAVIQFAQNLAPFARAAGIGQKELLGLSTAMVRVGADSNASANAFNTIISDLVTLSQTGSPELMKYSNAVGMTLDSFKQMAPMEQFIKVVDAVNKSGTKGIQVLNNMGIDGIRTAKAFAALATEAGGVQAAIDKASGAYGQGATEKGSKAAWDDLEAKLTSTRNIMEKFTSDIGDYLLPVTKGLLDVFNSILGTVTKLAAPLMGFAGIIAGVTGALAGIGGSILTAMGPLSSLMLAMTMFRLAPVRTMFSGVADAMAARRGFDDRPMSRAGQMMANNVPMAWYQKYPYMMGAGVGSQLGRIPAGTATGFRSLGTGVLNLTTSMTDAQSNMYDNARKQWWNRQSSVFGVPGGGDMRVGGRMSWLGGFAQGMFQPNNPLLNAARGVDEAQRAAAAGQEQTRATAAGKAGAFLGGEKAAKAFSPAMYEQAYKANEVYNKTVSSGTEALKQNLVAAKANLASTIASTGSQRALGMAAVGTAKSLLGVTVAAARFGASTLVKAPFQMLGGMMGMGAAAGASIAAIGGAAFMTKQSIESVNSKYTGLSNIAPFNAALGIATPALNEFTYALKKAIIEAPTTVDAMKIAAKASQYSNNIKRDAEGNAVYTDPVVKSLPNDLQAIVGYLQSLGELGKDQAVLATTDLRTRFGNSSIVDKAIAAYDAQTNSGASPFGRQYGGKNAPSNLNSGVENILSGVPQAQFQFRGPTQWATKSLTTEANDLIRQGMTAIGMEADTYAGKQGARGEDLQPLVEATRTRQALELLLRQSPEMGDTNGILAAVDNLSTRFGSQQRLFGKNDSELSAAVKEGGIPGLVKAISESDQDANKQFVQMMSMALNEGDLYKVLTRLADKPAAFLGSDIGEFEARNKGVARAMALGEGSQAPDIVFNAVRDIADYMKKSSSSNTAMTARAVAYMNTLDPNSRGFTANSAALQLQQQRNLYSTSITQGAMAASGQRYAQNATAIKFGSTNDPNSLAEDNLQIEQDTHDKAAQYLLFVKDFYRQRIYAAQDFARQLQKASEDAAKSLFDPYARKGNPGTISMDMAVANFKDQILLQKQQEKNIKTLLSWGMSEQVIAQMDLRAPEKSFQVQAFIDEGKGQAKKLNSSAGQAVDLGKQYVEESVDWKRAQKEYEIQRDRQMKALRLYGQEVLKDTKTILAETQGYLKKMGTTETTYLTNLTALANKILGIGSTTRSNSATLAEKAALLKPGQSIALGRTAVPDGTQSTSGMPVADLASVSVTKGVNGQWTATGTSGNPISIGGGRGDPKGNWSTWTRKQRVAWYQRNEMALTANTATGDGAWHGDPSHDNWNKPGYGPGGAAAAAQKVGWQYAIETNDGWLVKGPKMSQTVAKDRHFEDWDPTRKMNWYNKEKAAGRLAEGGIAMKSTWRQFGEEGPEAVIPLNGSGIRVLSEAFRQAISMDMVKGLNSNRYASSATYRGSGAVIYNNSTNFNGPIRVEAQDPNEMARKLKEKARLKNLGPSKGQSFSAS